VVGLLLKEEEDLSDTDSSSDEEAQDPMAFRQQEGMEVSKDRTKKIRLINDPLIDSS